MLLKDPIQYVVVNHEIPHWEAREKKPWLAYARLDGDNSDVGFDIRCAEIGTVLAPMSVHAVSTGVLLQPPCGYYVEVCSRSGLGRQGILLTAGQIDPGYRGELAILLYNTTKKPVRLYFGDRLAQGVLRPALQANFEQVNHLPESVRGANGLGSTGVK